jgi:hypothetical protein
MGFSTSDPLRGCPPAKPDRASPLTSLRSKCRQLVATNGACVASDPLRGCPVQACPRGPSPTARAWSAIGSCLSFQSPRSHPLMKRKNRRRRALPRLPMEPHCYRFPSQWKAVVRLRGQPLTVDILNNITFCI